MKKSRWKNKENNKMKAACPSVPFQYITAMLSFQSLVAISMKRPSVTGKEERVVTSSGVRVINKLKIPTMFATK